MCHPYWRHPLVEKFGVPIEVHHVKANTFALGPSNPEMEPGRVSVFEGSFEHVRGHVTPELRGGFEKIFFWDLKSNKRLDKYKGGRL